MKQWLVGILSGLLGCLVSLAFVFGLYDKPGLIAGASIVASSTSITVIVNSRKAILHKSAGGWYVVVDKSAWLIHQSPGEVILTYDE